MIKQCVLLEQEKKIIDNKLINVINELKKNETVSSDLISSLETIIRMLE